MWPWEHLTFGYVLVSLWARVRGRQPPGDVTVVAATFGTQLPDLIDKPGAWLFGILPSGISLGHSVLFAVPVAVAGVVLGRRLGHGQVGWGFAIGLLSHLAGDVIWPLALGGDAPSLLWPLVPVSADNGPFLGRTLELWTRFYELLGTPLGAVYLGVELGFVLFTLVLWHRDGYPGLGAVRRLRQVGRSEETDDRP